MVRAYLASQEVQRHWVRMSSGVTPWSCDVPEGRPSFLSKWERLSSRVEVVNGDVLATIGTDVGASVDWGVGDAGAGEGWVAVAWLKVVLVVAWPLAVVVEWMMGFLVVLAWLVWWGMRSGWRLE